jgi:hypothetical protein
MKKLLWLDDDPMSISYDKDALIPNEFDDCDFKIEFFEKISELMEFLYQNSKTINSNDIFIIDIMLMDEEKIILPNSDTISIPDDLMAGAILYSEFLKDKYPDNPIILYTSREHQSEIFQNITNDPRFHSSLFLIDKWKKDTSFIEVISKFLREQS